MLAHTNTQQLTKVVIFGVGLIGGSFALALKKQAAVKQIVGVERNQNALERALGLGIIDVAGADLAAALDGADLVLIAAPVAQTEAILRAIYPHLQAQTIVTDAGSTKADVVEAARRALEDKISQFVPAHPIAGRESNGPDAAIANLYQGKKLVITALPENSPSALNLVANTWQRCGAVPYYLNPAEHDQVFAAVSHLPHLLAYALVDQITEQPQAELRFQYAASGFRDFTRIAGSSPEMWRDISLANRAALLVELTHYQAQLQRISNALQHSDGEQLLAIFSNAQAARQRWSQSIESAEPPPKEGGD
ncbi:prephenate dehydrogenase [Solimicrobium silvestre]|uniref:prephenate dehydrogenase n=1 Tax=Solimicrobium silvestre TaxID=2099400 RepID=A0A2S9GZ47_9BURK|nr:prephenate dehydrogenase/arogenate dehydrogenase family protein [Solimicrobium silvestre]PRC93004.1 Prephenate dehydrogenase [Solimicrobium silvestre]